jgi:TonB family protein
MAPNLKESETAVATTTPASTAAPVAKSKEAVAARPQPVALEIPVTINGARTVEGSDKREPFSESSKTVLVFGHGAVIRLASSVASGQLVFLTNEKTRKEVVCQVVKSKNYRTVTGYVELQFTEPAVGFWGMRFPADRIGPTPSTPVATARAKLTAPSAPAQPKTVPATPPVAPNLVSPAVPVVASILAKPIPVAPLLSSEPRITGPAVIAPPAAKPEPPNSTAHLNTVSQANPVLPTVVVPPPASLPVIPAIVPPAPITAASGGIFAPPQDQLPDSPKAGKSEATMPSTAPSLGELKLQAARLQEQLGSLLFHKAPTEEASVPSPSEHALPTPQAVNPATKVLELAHADPKLPKQATEKTPVSAPDEEVKIPSWLAPLSRETQNTVEASSAETLADREPTSGDIQNPEESFTVPVENSGRKAETAVFGSQLLGEVSSEAASSESGSKKALFVGIAAALLMVAGGTWYSRQPGNFISGLFESKPAPAQVSNGGNPGFASPSSKTESAATPTPDATSFAPSSVTTTALGVSEPVSNGSSAPNTSVSMTSAPMSKNADPVFPNASLIEEPKKPALGNVRLAKPVVSRHSPSQAGIEAEPALEAHQIPGGGATLPDLAAARRAEPAEPSAPLAVGGEVKQAQLIKSVSPVYPPTAKLQHVAGDVKIDALIEADGNVSTMKILSGPPLLHQAALTAVKQWKYKPAQLDGKPTAMHLTVTVQFRFQQ